MKKSKSIVSKTILLIVGTLFVSCSALQTAAYDQYSYQKSIEIKVDASRLMDKATTAYDNHKDEIDNLHLEIEKIVAYEKDKPNNEITYAMWQLLSDDEKNLLSGFFKRWEEKETLSSVFINEAKIQIMEAMDVLIQFEGKKDKQAKARLLELISGN